MLQTRYRITPTCSVTNRPRQSKVSRLPANPTNQNQPDNQPQATNIMSITQLQPARKLRDMPTNHPLLRVINHCT